MDGEKHSENDPEDKAVALKTFRGLKIMLLRRSKPLIDLRVVKRKAHTPIIRLQIVKSDIFEKCSVHLDMLFCYDD